MEIAGFTDWPLQSMVSQPENHCSDLPIIHREYRTQARTAAGYPRMFNLKSVTLSGQRLTIRYEMKCRSCILRFSFFCQLVWQVFGQVAKGPVATDEDGKIGGQMASKASKATVMDMANPRPSNLCVSFLNVLIPITAPWAVTRGPPLLPG